MARKPADSSQPRVVVSARGANRLKSGHVWVYRSDIVSADGITPGALVAIHDDRSRFLGSALYSTTSQIAVRMISHDSITDFPALLKQRLAAAIAYREQVVSDSDAYRIVFSEADFLPGLIVDRYHDILSMQVLTQAMDQEPARAAILDTLSQSFHPAGIIERVDPHI